jgi:hypothetical protein
MVRLAGTLLTLAVFAGAVVAQTALVKVSGEVVVVDGVNLELKSSEGTIAIRLGDQARMSARSPTGLDAIREGAYLGTTATPQADGTLRASEVHVFAESMRGTGEGHRPMANEPGHTMTNATVANVGGRKQRDAPADATVVSVDNIPAEHELRVTLRYKGGEQVVIVPDDVPVVMTEPGDRAMLVPGTHIVAYLAQQPDGSLLAERVTIGKNGYAPLQ